MTYLIMACGSAVLTLIVMLIAFGILLATIEKEVHWSLGCIGVSIFGFASLSGVHSVLTFIKAMWVSL